ncbi:MAG: TRAP transporter permease [Bdellovibrionales bacterium]|nr:TRAP transporter permease [Bdellovibrionales bacterium]
MKTSTSKQAKFIAWVGFAWALFQVIVPILTINDTILRSVHLSFASFLVFFSFPKNQDKISKKLLNGLLSCVACFCALYLFIDYEGLSARPGLPLTRDLLIGAMGLILLMEASRRCLGIALPILVMIFISYCFLGPYLPSIISHRGASLSKTIYHLYLTTEGVFGVPLRVSSSFVFLFVLLGSLLDRAGAGQYFIDLSFSLLGKFRAGPAKAAVVASGLTGMISGSSIANTVTTGTFTIPLMKKIGFTPEKAAAVEVAASTNGQLMPPLMGAAAFIIAEFLGISYIQVVKAAAIPAFASYIGLFALVHFESYQLDIQTLDQNIERFSRVFFRGVHFFLPIVALIVSLGLLKQSPTMAAFYACIAVSILILIQELYRKKNQSLWLWKACLQAIKELFESFYMGAQNMIPIAIATATAGIIVGCITLTGLGQSIMSVIEILSFGNIYLVLIFVAITCLILGMGLPTTANYIVVSSLAAPIILKLGAAQGLVIPAIAAHLFVFYFGILADDTPPVGLAAYAASGIAHSDPIKTGIQGFTYDIRTAILPFIFIFSPHMLLISGVKDHESAFYASSWIWIHSIPQIVGIFVATSVGMVLFASSISGYLFGPLTTLPRIVVLFLSYSFFRYDQIVHASTLLTLIHICILALPTGYLIYDQIRYRKGRHE